MQRFPYDTHQVGFRSTADGWSFQGFLVRAARG
jgi:hypothetical protein